MPVGGLTIRDLLRSRQRHDRYKSKVNPVRFNGIKEVSAAFGSLYVEASYTPLSDDDPQPYETIMIFHGIQFADQQSQEFPIEIQTSELSQLQGRGRGKGHTLSSSTSVWASKPSLSKSHVQIQCTCDDQYFTWWYYNKDAGANYMIDNRDFPPPPVFTGSPVRTSDKQPYGAAPNYALVNYDPRRNPKHLPGICKHNIHLARRLSQIGWFGS